MWHEHFDPDVYPTMTRVWTEGGHEDQDDPAGTDAAADSAARPHLYGLRRLLDGIEASARQP